MRKLLSLVLSGIIFLFGCETNQDDSITLRLNMPKGYSVKVRTIAEGQSSSFKKEDKTSAMRHFIENEYLLECIADDEEGLMTIQSGQKMILAQADMDIGLPESEEPAEAETSEEKPGISTGRMIAYGALGVVAIVGILSGLSGGGGGGGNGAVSPSTP